MRIICNFLTHNLQLFGVLVFQGATRKLDSSPSIFFNKNFQQFIGMDSSSFIFVVVLSIAIFFCNFYEFFSQVVL